VDFDVRDDGDTGNRGTNETRPIGLDEELALVWPLLGRQIAFHRRLVDLTASVKAALLLSQALYWTRHGRDIEQCAGWFYKTIGQWEMETGLSTKGTGGCAEILSGSPFWTSGASVCQQAPLPPRPRPTRRIAVRQD
jgi:hypothetical protein